MQIHLHRNTLESIPKGTQRLQIKGYLIHKDEQRRYLFCTCIDENGCILARREGTASVVYEDVYISYSSIITSLKQLDYIFYLPGIVPSDFPIKKSNNNYDSHDEKDKESNR